MYSVLNKLKKFTIATALLLSSHAILKAQAGALDVTFDTDGKSSFLNPIGSGAVFCKAMAIQADGKILTTGYFLNVSHYDVFVTRLNADGSIDQTFGTNGSTSLDLGFGEEGNAIAVQNDGKIVVAGNYYNGTDQDILLLRYNSDGTLDNTFDGNGIAGTGFNAGSFDYGRTVIIDNNGKIIVGGFSNGLSADFAMVRFNTDGSIDQNFGNDGLVLTNFSQATEELNSIAFDANGKIYAVGITNNSGNYDMLIARYNSDGSSDITYNGLGYGTIDWAAGSQDYANKVLVQNDGKIVVIGSTYDGVAEKFTIVRIDPTTATLDGTFDSDGMVSTLIGTGAKAFSGAIQADGKIVIGGSAFLTATKDFALARYNSNGSLDMSFGTNGIVSTDFLANSQSDELYEIALQSDGKILAAGYTGNGNSSGVARFLASGTSDNASKLEENFSVYPNPINNHFNIDLGKKYTNVKVVLTNIEGKVVMNKSFENADKMNLEANINAGMYFLKVTSNDETLLVTKLIK